MTTDQRDIRDDERTRCRREEARRIGLKEGSDWAGDHAPNHQHITGDYTVSAWQFDVTLSDDTECRGVYVTVDSDGICQHDDWIEGGRATLEEIAGEALEGYLQDCRDVQREGLHSSIDNAIPEAMGLEHDLRLIANQIQRLEIEQTERLAKLRRVLQELKDTIERMEAAL